MIRTEGTDAIGASISSIYSRVMNSSRLSSVRATATQAGGLWRD